MSQRRMLAPVLGALVLVCAGCATDTPLAERVVVCWGTGATPTDDGVVSFTFEQHGDVVATASGPPDVAFAADVPAGAVTTVLVDGQPFGHVGIDVDDDEIAVDENGQTLGYYALMGEGCPDPALLGQQVTPG